VFINGIYFQETPNWSTAGCCGAILNPANGGFATGATRATRTPNGSPNTKPKCGGCSKVQKGSDEILDAELRQRGLSLRVVVKEIPSVFASFF